MLSALRRQAWSGLLLLALVPGLADAALPARVQGERLPTLAPMLEDVTPAVVNVATRGKVRVENPLLSDPFFRRFFDLPQIPQQREVQNLGSGVIVDADNGYIITNHHVIQQADEIQVTLADGRSFKAELVGTDPESDVALIRIDAKNLTAATLGDSQDLRVGDFVVAIGNPFGLGQTVTSGIVSALGRSGLGIEGYEDFIQTDASINPGNSGGALVNLRGELVGVNTAILSRSGGNIGIGFAIPINMAQAIMQQLVEHGEVRRGQLGVLVQDLTPRLAQAFGLERGQGAVVARVQPGSPAAEAGLEEGDVILEVGGEPVESAADLRNRIGLLSVGEQVRLEVHRDGETRTVTVRIGKVQAAQVEGGRIHRHLEGAMLGAPEASGAPAGVAIRAVERGAPAWRAGLRPGDVIVSANRERVEAVEDLQRVARRDPARLLLNVRRDGGAFYLLLQ